MKKIELGDKVRCKYTGFTGIAVARTEFINGCVQFSVVPSVGKDNKLQEDVSFDEDSLKIIQPLKKKIIKKDTGGPMGRSVKMRGF